MKFEIIINKKKKKSRMRNIGVVGIASLAMMNGG
jgi:hypothetical protein